MLEVSANDSLMPESPVRISVELRTEQACAFAQFLKRARRPRGYPAR
jgi:hypothetical protein